MSKIAGICCAKGKVQAALRLLQGGTRGCACCCGRSFVPVLAAVLKARYLQPTDHAASPAVTELVQQENN